MPTLSAQSLPFPVVSQLVSVNVTHISLYTLAPSPKLAAIHVKPSGIGLNEA